MAWAQVIEINDATALNNAITPGAQIRLTDNITLSSYLNIPNNYTVTINLNGHTLSRSLTSATSDGCVIVVAQTGNLTLEGGTVSGGWNSSTTGNTAGGIVNKGTLTLTNVTIDNCKGDDGGGINNASGATLDITSGTISNCLSNQGGGGIVNKGTATVSGCAMSTNTATTRGGAIWNNSNLTMSGCTFSDNNATNNDGGALHLESGTATLTDVTITNNTSKDAGGIYVKSGAMLNLGGATGSILSGNTSSAHGGGGIVNYGTVAFSGIVNITGNTCHTDGSGIWSNGTLEMEGNIQIKDNTYDDLYLKDDKVITITGALTGGQNSIGIRMETPKKFTSGYQSHNTVTNHFFPSGTINTMGLVGDEGKMYFSYYECSWDSENNQLVHTLQTIPYEITIDNICSSKYACGGDLWGDNYWFIANGTGSTTHGLTCQNGDVHLILCDGANITINEGLYLNSGTTLHIYSQSYGDRMGKLVSENTLESEPGIGPKHDGSYMGVLDIHGGDIKAKGGQYAAGIGGCEDKPSAAITIWDGKIDATGGENGAGIGGGEGGSADGDILIYGGDIKVTGGSAAAGIGGGQYNSGGGDSHRIEIFGGKVNATGAKGLWDDPRKSSGAGIGSGSGGKQIGPIIIWGGDVTARGGEYAAGIGGGDKSTGGPITIHEGIVTAYAGIWGAGIGGGFRDDDSGGDGGTITITGGTVIANSECGAAIGGGTGGCGENNNGGTITITGGSVVAVAMTCGAGIGGGDGEDGGTITISGGEVMAVGGAHKLSFLDNTISTMDHLMQCLLLSRKLSRSSSLFNGLMTEAAIQLGQVLAYAISGDSWGGAGIGGGYWGDGGTVNITGGVVVAQGGHAGSNAIGKGYKGDNIGSLEIFDGAMVSAGSDEKHYSLKLVNQRKSACRNNLFVIIEPCGHRDATLYTDNGDGTYTTEDCPHCSLTGPDTLMHSLVHRGDWNDADHWNSGHVPNPGNSVILRADCTIPNGYTAVANNIDIPAIDTLTIADGGQLIHSDEGVLATVEKHIAHYSGEGGYYLLTNPVADEQNPDSLGMTKHEYDLYWFDQSQELEWRNYKQIAFNFENGKGYLYANSNDTLLSFSGELNHANADVSVPVIYDANADFAGWNLVGNPFVCDAYLADSRDFYVLNPAGDEVVTATTNVIAPMQGIFVQAAANENTVSFTTTAPAQGRALNIGLSKVLEPVEGPTRVSTGSTPVSIDNARIRFGEGRNLEKFQLNPNHSKLYILQEDKDYAVIRSETQGELPINFKAKENGTYTLNINSENMAFNYLHLIDNLTGEDIDLVATPTYTFTTKTTDYTSRFRLVFSSICEDADGDNKAFAFIDADGKIIITGVVDACDASLQVIDMMGRIVTTHSGHIQCVPTSGMTAGVYVLRLIDGNDIRTQKIVIQ